MQVAVVIPVFNGAATVASAIDSALGQSCEGGHEVVVVDDGSTDPTPNVLTTFVSRVRVIRQANRGLAAARNAGAMAARSEYIAFLDADDVWQPEKLTSLVNALGQSPGAVLAYSDVIAVNDRGEPAGVRYIDAAYAHAPSMADLLARWWPILPSTVLMRRATYEACQGFCEEYRRAYEDVDLWLRARERGDFIFVEEPLVRYRVTPIGDRMRKYEMDYAIFARRTAERYGHGADELLRATRHAYASALGASGVTALHSGDRAGARRALIGALRYQPWHWRNTLRLARCFLPLRLARALSGGSRNKSAGQD